MQTNASLIIDLTNNTFLLTKGTLCENKYYTYHSDGYGLCPEIPKDYLLILLSHIKSKKGQPKMPSKLLDFRGTHYEIGVQHGQELSEVIENTVLPFIRADMNDLGISLEQARKVTSGREKFLEKHFPNILDETKGIAEGAEITFEEALLMLCFWAIRKPALESFTECSSFIAAGEATVEDSIIACQNSDWPNRLKDKDIVYTFRVEPQGKYRFIGRGLAGNLGRPSVIGFNEAGLTFVASGIRVEERGKNGFSPLTMTRIALEDCATVEEFLNMVESIPKWSGGENVDVVDKSGDMARISFSTHRTLLVRTKNHFLASTNHYHNLEMRHLGPSNRKEYPSSYARYERLVGLLRDNHGDINSERAVEMMSDHKYGDEPPEGVKSICRHGEDVHTMTSVILAPDTGEFWLCPGNPCEKEYQKYNL